MIRVDNIKYGVKFPNLPLRYSLHERYIDRAYVTSNGRHIVIYDKYTQTEIEMDEYFKQENPHLFRFRAGIVNRIITAYNREDQEYLAEINEYCG